MDVKTTTERLRREMDGCSSEEDLRVNVEMVFRAALPELPVPKYEQAIKTSTFQGRADAVHQGVVVEYEKPKSQEC